MNTSRSLRRFAVLAVGILVVMGLAMAAPAPTPRPPNLQLSFQAHPNSVWSMVFTPDGKKLLSLGDDCAAKLWDVANGKQIALFPGQGRPAEGRLGTLSHVALSPDGKTIASGGINGTIGLWDVATGKNVATLPQPKTWPLAALCYSRDGKSLFSLGRGRFRGCLWDLKTKKERAIMKGLDIHNRTVAAFDGNDNPLLITWLIQNEMPSFDLWTVDSDKKPAATFNVPPSESFNNRVESVAFGPDCQTIAIMSPDNTVWLWDAATGKNTAILKNGSEARSRGLAFSPDGKILAAGYRLSPPRPRLNLRDPIPNSVVLYEVATGKVLATLNGNPRPMSPFVFSPNGRTLATGDGPKIMLWSLPVRYTPPK